MKEGNIAELRNPGSSVRDPLTEILRNGARKLLAEAIEMELEAFLAEMRELRDPQGRLRVVRNGYLPERKVQTGIGDVGVRVPRVRDRCPDPAEGPIRFCSKILPRYLRRTKSLEELIPWLYLKGVSTGDMSEALTALLGPGAAGLSPSTVARLKQVWQEDLERWRKRDLSRKRYVYFWADGIYFNVRGQKDKPCILVIIGAQADGKKELVALGEGYRESELSWKEVLLELKEQGLSTGPTLAVGDGALGFWKALREVFGNSRKQRCWVHKTANVLNKLPKSLQKNAKKLLQEIWMAPSKEAANKAFDKFVCLFGAKYPKACEILSKDRDDLLAFYDFPAEHWKHLRTTNPIESTFATVRLRTDKTRNCYTADTVLVMVFQLCRSAQRTWRRLDGAARLAEVVEGVKFVNGIKEEDAPLQALVHNI